MAERKWCQDSGEGRRYYIHFGDFPGAEEDDRIVLEPENPRSRKFGVKVYIDREVEVEAGSIEEAIKHLNFLMNRLNEAKQILQTVEFAFPARQG